MAKLIAWLKAHQAELLCVVLAFLAAILLFLACFYVPRPKLIDTPKSTKDPTVTLKGKAKPHLGIAVFDKAGNPLVLVGTNDAGEFSVSGIPIGEGENIFRLRAVSAGWRASFPVVVKIQKDTTAPALDVTRLEGATVTGSNTVVNGKAEPGSTVTVNGVKTTVNPDGTWTATVALKPGDNQLVVAATDSAGNTTTDTQSIKYTPTAADSQVGTATVASSTTAFSAGSLPPSTTGTASGTSTTSTTAAAASSTAAQTTTAQPTTSSPTAVKPATTTTVSPTTTPPPAPVEQKIVNIAANAWVSNPSPNDRANETIYVSVKDNFGRPVTAASVMATVQYKTGAQTYTLSSQGNGTYAVSFKLNDKYVSGYRVQVSATARYEGFMSTAFTAFTPS